MTPDEYADMLKRNPELQPADQMNADGLTKWKRHIGTDTGSDTGHVNFAVSASTTAPKELDEQAAFFAWAAVKRQEWPELWQLYANVNGQYRPGQKPEPGLMKGVPDIFLAVPIKTRLGGIVTYSGMYIELKRDGRQNEKRNGKHTGGLSDEQIDWIERLRKYGYCVAICYGCGEAIAAVGRYLGRSE